MKGKIGAIILGIVMVFCLIACIVCLEKIPPVMSASCTT